MLRVSIVCLANSYKHQGSCIAGKIWDGSRPGQWVRPVADAGGGALPRRALQPGAVVEMPLAGRVPLGHQRENYLLGEGHWRMLGHLPWSGLTDFLDPPAPLWQSGHHSSCGLNDRVPAGTASESLRLIAVDRLDLTVTDEGKLRGQFRYQGMDYDLCVTDRRWRCCHVRYLCGRPLQNVILCISLGEDFKGYCYKLIAAILWERRYR
ncbi:hypothetical protein MIN45_P1317 [Methylomarinovum tepidoasis]|uniref:Dual OB-containing domain-containing protein n=1 Tax=Methylomarinovum tepidoasis TaxID=2840183 RepID=A0AAU9C5Z6_9GAMM|nr:hypothetical protein [Methylomarinovum sp. IN45]BCX88947.1 hypothetical protein MIN45_P1317 [Methylomarinovum sp. IN45]